MKIKKIKFFIIILIFIPVIFAAVIRTTPTSDPPTWICPDGFIVTLKQNGASVSYSVEEILSDDWIVSPLSHIFTGADLTGSLKSIGFIGIPATDKTIRYILQVPVGIGYSLTGYYSIDGGMEKEIPTTNFIVHSDTCTAGTEDDLDSDGYGPGCACPGVDCCDAGDENSLGCSDATKTDMNPGEQEDNTIGENDGIDQDCDGCDFIDLDNDGYKALGTGCGADDCDDNDFNVNPGKTEIPNNNKDDDCAGGNICGNVNGDCQPEQTDQTIFTFYDQDCDCNVDDDKKLLFIQNYLAGIIGPPDMPLQWIVDNIPGSGYTNP